MDAEPDSPAQAAWAELLAAEQRFSIAQMTAVIALKQDRERCTAILRSALLHPTNAMERHAALRMLRALDESVRQAIFPILMDLAAHDTNYIVGARAAITSIDPAWLEAHLPTEVDRILSAATDDPYVYDPYRRLAELLQLLHSPYLHVLVERARQSSDADVREVAEDF